MFYKKYSSFSIDPRGRSAVTAGSDHYFHTCSLFVRQSVPTFQNLTKQNNMQVKKVIATGRTVGLAEWIIDDICLVNVIFKWFLQSFISCALCTY